MHLYRCKYHGSGVPSSTQYLLTVSLSRAEQGEILNGLLAEASGMQEPNINVRSSDRQLMNAYDKTAYTSMVAFPPIESTEVQTLQESN